MSNLIEITQDEVTMLIGLADRENPLPLRFGGGRVWLDLDVATNRVTDHLKKMRRQKQPSTNRSSAPAAPTGDTQSGERPPASAAMGHSAGAEHTPQMCSPDAGAK